MRTTLVTNIGAIATGDLQQPTVAADTILIEDGCIAAIGRADEIAAGDVDIRGDCQGTTAMPGLIDSHCHTVLGDFTPR